MCQAYARTSRRAADRRLQLRQFIVPLSAGGMGGGGGLFWSVRNKRSLDTLFVGMAGVCVCSRAQLLPGYAPQKPVGRLFFRLVARCERKQHACNATFSG